MSEKKAPAPVAERCACGHSNGTPCRCVGCDCTPAPVADGGEILYGCQFCRVLEPEQHKSDCEILALRAEVEEWKEIAGPLDKDVKDLRAALSTATRALREIRALDFTESNRIAAAALGEIEGVRK